MPTENELDEKKKKSQKTLEEQLAELLFDDKKKKKDIRFYTFYYNYDKPFYKKIRNKMDVMSAKQESETKGMDLDADNLKAAKEGRLFIVSDDKPFLQKVCVNEEGVVSLEVVTKNPITISDRVQGEERKAMESLQKDFETLTQGNLSETDNFITKRWKNRSARNKAREIADRADEAYKEEQRRNLQEAKKVNEKVKKTRMVKLEDPEKREMAEEKEPEPEKKPEEAEEVTEENNLAEPEREPELESEKEPEPEKETELESEQKPEKEPEPEPDTEKSAAEIAMELKKISERFSSSKYLDENAIESGLELKQQMERLEKSGNTELLDKLKEEPLYKENKELYQGQANLAEMGQRGQEARQKLREQEEQKDKTADPNLVLDILAAECASAIIIKNALGKDTTKEMNYIKKQPNAQKTIGQIEDTMRNTDAFRSLMEGTPEELSFMFSNHFTSQKVYGELNHEIQGMKKRIQEQKEMKMEQKHSKEAPVMENQEKKAPQRAV